ncbi:MAG: hypothetical protein ACOC9Y_02260 [Chloroflexota bacterium]
MTHPSPLRHRGRAPSPPTRGAAFPAWLRPAVAEARTMDLPYDPVFLDSAIGGPMLLTVLARLGAEVELDEARLGWHACSKGRSATYELAPSLRRQDPDCEVTDFDRFTLEGRVWLADRIVKDGRGASGGTSADHDRRAASCWLDSPRTGRTLAIHPS